MSKDIKGSLPFGLDDKLLLGNLAQKKKKQKIKRKYVQALATGKKNCLEMKYSLFSVSN